MNIWEWSKEHKAYLSDLEYWRLRVECGPLGRVVYARINGWWAGFSAPDGWVIEEVEVDIESSTMELEVSIKLRRKPVTIYLEFRSQP